MDSIAGKRSFGHVQSVKTRISLHKDLRGPGLSVQGCRDFQEQLIICMSCMSEGLFSPNAAHIMSVWLALKKWTMEISQRKFCVNCGENMF